MKTHHQFRTAIKIILLVFLIQSCAGTKEVTDQVQEITDLTIVKTYDGYTYNLPWYEVRDGMLVSKLNTTRFIFKKDQIIDVANYDPEPHKVQLRDAINHYGDVSIVAYDHNKVIHHYRFYNLDEYAGNIVGYRYTGDYPADIRIPLSNVKKVNVQSIDEQLTKEAAIKFAYFMGLVALEAFIWYGSCSSDACCYYPLW